MTADLSNSPVAPTAETLALLDFARPSAVEHGFGWLDDDGAVDRTMPVFTWISGRMTHCFALGHLLGVDGCLDLAAHGVRTLATSLRDPEHPGWLSAVDHEGAAVDGPKVSYDHSFVILGAASAHAAGVPGASELLRDALDVTENHWWDEAHGMVTDQATRDFRVTDPYRGANANMHTVEAFLSAAAATGDDLWLDRALRIVTRIAAAFEAFGGRLPEHFDEDWTAIPGYNRDKVADAFRPYGSTIGHWLEWSRLMLHVRTELAARGRDVPDFLDRLPAQLYERSLAEGWAPDGQDGFVYTVDFDGTPVVAQRMHWVLCEAIGAAAALSRRTADPRYDEDAARFWDYARAHLIQRPGAWWPELNPDNSPAAGTWAGKPDIYHALQATVVGQLPLAPPFAWALAEVPSSGR